MTEGLLELTRSLWLSRKPWVLAEAVKDLHQGFFLSAGENFRQFSPVSHPCPLSRLCDLAP